MTPILALSLLTLAAPDVPDSTAAQEPVPHPALPAPDPLASMLLDTGEILIRPFQPRLCDAAILAPATLLTVLALRLDVPLYRMVRHRWFDPPLMNHRLSYWGSFLGEGAFDVTAFAMLGVVGGERGARAGVEGMEALAAVAVLSRLGKVLLRVERPSFDPDHKHYFSRRLAADAMPSGHTMAAFATAEVLAEEYSALAPLFYLLAAYVGVARVQQSTHWVSDVIVGTALGIVLGRAAVELHHSGGLQVSASGQGLLLSARF